MIRGFLRLVLVASAAVAGTGASLASAQTTAVASAEPTHELVRAEQLLKEGKWKEAHDLIVPWLHDYPKSPERDRGLYLLAEVYYQNGDRIRAFYHLDELMDNFPESKLFFTALELQYRIADSYLNGFKETFLGMRIVPQYEEAIEMLYRIQERSPGSPLAEKALKRTADYYFNNSEFDLAGDAYGAFIRIYPRSPEIPQVRLREAFSSLAQFRGPQFDATPLIDARARFKEIQARYPDLAADANVAGWIERIDADLAHKAYLKGDFYRRTNQPHGAAFQFRYVIQTYPASKDADLARRALAALPKAVLSDPPPPPSNPESAATQPTAPEPGATEKPQ